MVVSADFTQFWDVDYNSLLLFVVAGVALELRSHIYINYLYYEFENYLYYFKQCFKCIKQIRFKKLTWLR